MKHEDNKDKNQSTDHSKTHACSLYQMFDPHKSAEVEGTIVYTCPMHLEIRQSIPGNNR